MQLGICLYLEVASFLRTVHVELVVAHIWDQQSRRSRNCGQKFEYQTFFGVRDRIFKWQLFRGDTFFNFWNFFKIFAQIFFFLEVLIFFFSFSNLKFLIYFEKLRFSFLFLGQVCHLCDILNLKLFSIQCREKRIK